MKKADLKKFGMFVLGVIVVLVMMGAFSKLLAATFFGSDMEKEYAKNSFNRLISNIEGLEEDKSRDVSIYLPPDYFIAGWNLEDGTLKKEECNLNLLSDVERPLRCGDFCICLMRRNTKKQVFTEECVEEIEGVNSFDTQEACKYV